MWIKRADYERLVRLAAQAGSLAATVKRAEDAESALAAERAAKDWLTIQLTSRVITKHGGYGLEEARTTPPAPHPKGFTHDPTDIDLAKLEFYRKCAVDAGFPAEDGERRWEAEMRGEGLPIETESEQ